MEQMDHRKARSLFLDAVEGSLGPGDSQKLELHLDVCNDCRTGFQQYSATVFRVRQTRREKAPQALATQVMRRIRRKRPASLRGQWWTHAQHRLPVELLIPLLVAAAVAVWLFMAAA
jgi:predicted anti-sigma-YlaC factor YlaD